MYQHAPLHTAPHQKSVKQQIEAEMYRVSMEKVCSLQTAKTAGQGSGRECHHLGNGWRQNWQERWEETEGSSLRRTSTKQRQLPADAGPLARASSIPGGGPENFPLVAQKATRGTKLKRPLSLFSDTSSLQSHLIGRKS